ncbi:MAG TPA: glycosyl hydrolase [Puia sp.]|nr:glycosyl hydrolase [Puia sp.]
MKIAVIIQLCINLCWLGAFPAAGREYHVSVAGNDDADGSSIHPLRTIMAASRVARAGDTITVHAGIYREWVDPETGGTNEVNRILYRSAAGEKVVVTGSEVVKGWKETGNGVWKVTLDNAMFGSYNPYREVVGGDWFLDLGRIHHTGEVYLNGKSFFEVASPREVAEPRPLKGAEDQQASLYQWCCKADSRATTIWANFHGSDPNHERVEINVRPSVFYPRRPGVNYITVRGFLLKQAATNWAPPTAEQTGLIGPHWSKGWIIEDNIISDSKCTGISLGADRMTGQNYSSAYKVKSGHISQLETIFSALRFGWSRETVGSHIVRRNIIFNCEQAGICGNMGAIFSSIYGNEIYNIYVKRQWGGFEMAGIKLHAPIDVLIKDNCVHHAFKGIWIDWEAQGIRITGNLLYDNSWMDLHLEVSHGPHIIDNNCFLSSLNLWNLSTGSAFINNLFAGQICRGTENIRFTPYHYPHSTAVAGIMTTQGGDDRYLHNVFIQTPAPGYDIFEKAGRPKRENGSMGYGLGVYNDYPDSLPSSAYFISEMSEVKLPVKAEGNVYWNGAVPYKKGVREVAVQQQQEATLRVEEKPDGVYLNIRTDGLPGGDSGGDSAGGPAEGGLKEIERADLGEAVVPGVMFEGPDGSPIRFDTDYNAQGRGTGYNAAGPFCSWSAGERNIKVWPKYPPRDGGGRPMIPPRAGGARAGGARAAGQGLTLLSRDFADPPASCRPGAYWCWLNGDVTDASLTHDLEEMKAKGMGRAEIWDVAAIYNPGQAYGKGPAFLGDQSVRSIRYALAEGKRLGLKLGLIGSSGWNAGGSWVKPDWAAKALYYSQRKVSGPSLFSGTIPFPAVPAQCPKDKNGMPVFFKEVAVLAVRDNKDSNISSVNDVRILNSRFDGRTLTWQVPPGHWTLLRFVCSNTGQHLIVPSPCSDGLLIDFLDPAATRRHLKYMLDRLGISTDNAGAVGLAYLSFDSMELDAGIPWTDSLASIFFAHNGYDILPFLPAFAGWRVPGGSAKFLDRYHKTISDQLIFSHYVTGKAFLSPYGIQLDAEAGGPGPPIWNSCPVEALKALGSVSVPRGEFWIRNRHHIFLVKEIASASHIYGLPLTDAEAFTTWRRWKDAPHDLKPYADRAFCEGMNSLTIHAFANTRPEFGLPGRAYHAGSDINPTATWWEAAKPFMDYLARCSYLLRQGQPVSDVAWYYGDKAPHFFPDLQGSPERPRLEGLSTGYDFDVVNTDVLLHRMTVSAGKLLLPDGVSYRLLVISAGSDIPAAVRAKIKSLIASGAHVLVEGASNAPANEFAGAARNISIDAALDKLGIAKDFTADTAKLDFIHRQTGDTQIYFVRNRTDRYMSEDCGFRAAGKEVERWDPVTGAQYGIRHSEVEAAGAAATAPTAGTAATAGAAATTPAAATAGTAATPAAGITRLKLRLAPYGSCFILFSPHPRQLREYEDLAPKETREVNGPWTVSFPKYSGAPDSIRLDTLTSWTASADPGVKYFSGTACYKKTVFFSKKELARDSGIDLNLGSVFDVAQVYINGKPAGTAWTYPFTLPIRDYLNEGANSMEIKVTNMWVNRLTGDMNLPDGKKYCRTNVPAMSSDRSATGDEKFHVQTSGLLGPVAVEEVPYRSAR